MALSIEKKVKQKDVEVMREGEQIILPKAMTYDEGILWLQRKKKEEEEVVAWKEVVNCFPLDGAYALMKALKRRFGWTSLQPTPGFFGNNPPEMVGMPVSVTENVQVAWGRVIVPKVEGHIDTGFAIKDGMVVFQMSGYVKKKDQHVMAEIAEEVRKIVREESVYRGKAIRVDFVDFTDDGFNPFTHAPRFLDTTKTRIEDLIFPETTDRIVKTTLFTPITHTALCREHKVPLKRGILLEGPYGCGKTMTANVTAKLCEQHGWTFIYLENAKELRTAMNFAKMYSPSVIFTEDIDRADSSKGNRDEEMNLILNVIDGVETKGAEVMVVVTTNHVERITQAMLRPGRLDAVIPVRPPDEGAVGRLIRLFAGKALPEDADITKVSRKLAGNIPAVIREVVERSKLASIHRCGETGEVVDLQPWDLEVSADGMLDHLRLLAPKAEDHRSEREKAAAVLAEGLQSGLVSTAQLLITAAAEREKITE